MEIKPKPAVGIAQCHKLASPAVAPPALANSQHRSRNKDSHLCVCLSAAGRGGAAADPQPCSRPAARRKEQKGERKRSAEEEDTAENAALVIESGACEPGCTGSPRGVGRAPARVSLCLEGCLQLALFLSSIKMCYASASPYYSRLRDSDSSGAFFAAQPRAWVPF